MIRAGTSCAADDHSAALSERGRRYTNSANTTPPRQLAPGDLRTPADTRTATLLSDTAARFAELLALEEAGWNWHHNPISRPSPARSKGSSDSREPLDRHHIDHQRNHGGQRPGLPEPVRIGWCAEIGVRAQHHER